MKHLLLGITLLASLLGYTQRDKYADQALKFAKEIIGSNDLSEATILLNDSLNRKELINELEVIRIQLRDDRNKVQFYVVKIDAPIPLYNINLHDPNELIKFGDFRILFNNENDILIDKWMFFSEDKKKKDDGKLELPRDTPLPPLPPPVEKR